LDIIEAHPKMNMFNLSKDSETRFGKFGNLGSRLNQLKNLPDEMIMQSPIGNREFYNHRESNQSRSKCECFVTHLVTPHDMFKSRRKRFQNIEKLLYR
jgi:hypothetical protein